MIRKAPLIVVAISALGLGLAGCSKQNHASAAAAAGNAATKTLPPNHPTINSQSGPAKNQPAAYRGTVEKTMVGGGYTYAEVRAGDQDVWLAGPKTDLSKGDNIGWRKGALMRNFTSPTLKRTFDRIYFVSSMVKLQNTATREGLVDETFNSGGYVYIKVREKSGSQWLAAPQTDIKKGDKVSWQGGELMHNFHSNTLNRTFSEILFVNQVNQG